MSVSMSFDIFGKHLTKSKDLKDLSVINRGLDLNNDDDEFPDDGGGREYYSDVLM